MSIEYEVLDEWDGKPANTQAARMVWHKDNHFPSVYIYFTGILLYTKVTLERVARRSSK